MEDEQEEATRSIKTTDKLNYRTEIQSKISAYLNAIGTFDLERAVLALRNSVLFDIPGLPFRTEIVKKERQLMREYFYRVVYLVKSNRDCWIHPIKRDFYNSGFKEKHYMNLAEFLLELIASHDGLVGVKGFVESGESKHDDVTVTGFTERCEME